LNRPTLPKELAEEAKCWWDQGLPMQEIAEKLRCNRDTVTKAIGHWFRSRGLEVPDGRTRRKEFPRKGTRSEDKKQTDQGTASEGAP
jgi:hypothetical protein